jgi:ParB family chromosome partitioning protein
MATARKGGLGRGLDALFVDNDGGDAGSRSLRLSEIEPNAEQPRKHFDEAALAELAGSIRDHGVLQPILVRPLPSGRYQLIAGERRWRAARMAGLTEVPVVVREMTDLEAMEFALIENLQREDLNPIEEALGYRQLMEEHGFTQEQVSARVGKSRPVIANALRLLNLPPEITDMVAKGEVSSGHARALLAIEDRAEALALAQQVKKGTLSVRDLEKYAKKQKEQKKSAPPKSDWGDAYFKELELAMNQTLARKVKIHRVGEEGGRLELDFYSRDDLADLARRLEGMAEKQE